MIMLSNIRSVYESNSFRIPNYPLHLAEPVSSFCCCIMLVKSCERSIQILVEMGCEVVAPACRSFQHLGTREEDITEHNSSNANGRSAGRRARHEPWYCHSASTSNKNDEPVLRLLPTSGQELQVQHVPTPHHSLFSRASEHIRPLEPMKLTLHVLAFSSRH